MEFDRTAWHNRRYKDNYRQEGEVHRCSVSRIVVPENIERREFSAPCFMCGERGSCRHRRSFA